MSLFLRAARRPDRVLGVVAFSLLLAVPLSLPPTSWADDGMGIVRGVVHHIRVHDGSIIDATYRTECFDYQCAAFIRAFGFHYGWYSTHDDLGNLSLAVNTPLGGAWAPVFYEEITDPWIRNYEIHEEFSARAMCASRCWRRMG